MQKTGLVLEVGGIACYVVSNKLSFGRILRFTPKGVTIEPIFPHNYFRSVLCPCERVSLHHMNDTLKEMPDEQVLTTLGLEEKA